jgi:hypothetical protein
VTIADLWGQIRARLSSVPAVVATLRPPASEQDFAEWAEAVGHPIPASLRALYGVHDGSSQIGGSGFNFVRGYYPLPISRAIERFRTYDHLTRLWGLPTAVPFASDYGGCLLAVRVDGSDELLHCFDDSPPMHGFRSITELLTQTIEALNGKDPDWRPNLNQHYLLWVNRALEEEDRGRRV